MSRKTFTTLSVVAFAALALVASEARATSNPDSFFDIFVEALGEPAGPRVWKEIDKATPLLYQNADGSIQTEIVAMSLSQSSSAPPPTVNRLSGGDFVVDSFFDIDYRFSSPSGSGDFQVDSFFDIAYEIEFTHNPGGSDDTSDHWDTEIVSMNLTGATPGPDNSSQLRLAPGVDHRGHVTILKVAGSPPGSDFNVDSFFDIAYEISLDGGNTWLSAAQGEQLSESVVGVPEPTSALLLLAGAGLIARRRRG